MNRFEIGDIVLYAAHGCCRIAEIEKRETGTYYVLVPINHQNTKFLVPTDNQNLLQRLRPLPSPKALNSSITRAAESDVTWIEDVATRRDTAKQVLAEGDEYDVLMLLRSLHAYKQDAKAHGKKALTSDAAILRAAQDFVRDEFSVVLGVEPHEVDEILIDRLEGY